MSSPMGAALQQVWAIFKQEQARQEQILRNALDSISMISTPSTADDALERLRSGLESLNQRHPAQVDDLRSVQERVGQLADHLAAGSPTNGRLQ